MNRLNRWRRRATPDDGSTCPVCGSHLGTAEPPRDEASGLYIVPPAMRLELGHRGQSYTWRVSLLAGRYRPRESETPPFNEYEVDFVYQLCGDGHLFPDNKPPRRLGWREDDTAHLVDEWNIVAAIGALASGKTYLLVRTLHQELTNLNGWHRRNDNRIRLRELNPLESRPLDLRSEAYNRTLATGATIGATSSFAESTPHDILELQFPGVLEDIKYLIARTVLDGERRAEEDWGRGFRQPLVVRTDGRNQRTWTGVADLPGEMFSETSASSPRESSRLRGFNALVWVIDPVIAANAAGWLSGDIDRAGASLQSLIEGSLRPGTVGQIGLEAVQRNRDFIQTKIGQQLVRAGGRFTVDRGEALRMLVAVSKCDLIHAALRQKPGRHLTDLGPPGLVEQGTATYLARIAERWAADEQPADAASARLLNLLNPRTVADPTVQRQRVLNTAKLLLDVYSDEQRFWNLVHAGEEDSITIPPGWTLTVPSIDDHIDAATEPASFNHILLRDLVMSAVGCGIAYAMGQENTVFNLLQERWYRLRIFLCSPLGTVPRANGTTISPLLAGDRFPRLDERSAALTQLLLAMLGKAHGDD